MGVTAEVTIKVRRGTKAELGTLGALVDGELGYVTDEDRVYIGDGTNNFLIGRVDYASTGPTGNGVAGTLYVNEATDEIYFSNGAGWTKVGVTNLSELSGNLDDIADGSSYKRVAISEFATGTNLVKQINDGTNVVTAAEARTHIDDSTKHRVINDSATGNTDLWSAHKILEYVSNNIDGLDWQNSVLDKDMTSPPTGPSEGDRYIVGPSADGGWSGHDGDIAYYQESTWVFIVPNEGFCARVEDEDIEYVYTGTEWISRPASTNHDNLSGLQGGTANEYYHLTAADYAALVTNQTETIEDIVGGMVSSNTETGISVTYDDSGGKLNFDISYGTEPPSVGPGSGTAGTASDLSRADHSHDLGNHGFNGAEHTVSMTPQALVAVGTGGNTIEDCTVIDGGTFV
jgi:hypothetical protein